MCVIRSLRWSFLFAIKPKIQQSYLFYIEKFQSEGGNKYGSSNKKGYTV